MGINELKADEVTLTTRTVDGRTYHEATARGFCSGPCATASAAIARVSSYHSGEAITTAPAGIASRVEMAAAVELRNGRLRIRGYSDVLHHGDFLSDSWVRTSMEIARDRLYAEPEFVTATKMSPMIQYDNDRSDGFPVRPGEVFAERD